MASDSDNSGKGGLSEAALFETISHETRIKVLFLLRNHNLGFSELKRELGISSSGNLQHHLGKLERLVEVNGDGQYSLTDNGREALMAIQSIRNMQDRAKGDLKVIVFFVTLIYYIVKLNLPFIMGTVDVLTPISAFIDSLVFGLVFYIVWFAVFKLILEKRAESSTWINGEE